MATRILIVEDHPTMREAMRLVLEGEGFEIDEAADGDLAMERIRLAPPDLALPRSEHPRDHRRGGACTR